MKKIKKTISIFLIAIMVILTMSPLVSATPAETTLQYICEDNSILTYYLDENGNPYYYQSNKKIYLILPEYSKKVEYNTEDLSSSESNMQENTIQPKSLNSAPTNYYSLMEHPVSMISNTYTQFITLENGGNRTSNLRKHESHPFIKVRTDNLGKPNILSSKRINIKITYYLDHDGWYEHSMNGVDATDFTGVIYESVSVINYFYVTVEEYKNPVWFDLVVWTTFVN